ncbi:hypothetical protein LCGC14_0832320 [marine sediment metagenome]|uniref:Uncharacterized protein n=1 Tax=marine sediment metagenome TaxID=412755 RepID=A0A0F9SMU1_9ZZZZ
MSDRLDYFFRQLLTEQELDSGFDKTEAAEQKLMTDQLLTGIFIGGEVAEHFPTPDLTVDIAGPLNAYDQLGRRIFFSPLQVLDMSVDELAVSTAVDTPGNEKILTIFVEFDRLLSDPRLDGNNLTVFFQRVESFKLNVVQSAEAAIGLAVPPAPRADQLILADVTIVNAQVAILDADIDASRRADVFKLTGAPNSITAGRVKQVLQDMLDILNGGIGGVDVIEGGDTVIDFSTLQSAIQDLAEQKHVGINYVFGLTDINPRLTDWVYSDALFGWRSTVIGAKADGWWKMQDKHKILEVDAFVSDGAPDSIVSARLNVLSMTTPVALISKDFQISNGSGLPQIMSFTFTPFTLGVNEILFIEFENTDAGVLARILRGGRVKARRIL